MPEAQIISKVFTLEEIWADREKALKAEEQHGHMWEELDEGVQIALKDVVSRMMVVMLEDLSWIQAGINVDQGYAIDVNFRVLFSEIQQEIVRKRAEDLRELEEARMGTIQMLKTLGRKGQEE